MRSQKTKSMDFTESPLRTVAMHGIVSPQLGGGKTARFYASRGGARRCHFFRKNWHLSGATHLPTTTGLTATPPTDYPARAAARSTSRR
jgi:hypothetical protein